MTCVASTQPKSCEKCAWCGPPFTRGCLGELSREKLALSQISHRHAASRYHPSHISARSSRRGPSGSAPRAPPPTLTLYSFIFSRLTSSRPRPRCYAPVLAMGMAERERCHPGPGRGQAEQFPPRNAQGCGAGGRHYSRHVRRTACTAPVSLACRRSVSWPLPSLTWTPPTVAWSTTPPDGSAPT